MKTASIIAAIFFVCALGAIALYVDRVSAGTPQCPSSWPEAPGERFFSDADGAEWFVIRSADSNGYETVRAYPADDRYAGGFAPGSPDEACFLVVRRPGSDIDLQQAEQVTFRTERERQQTSEPVATTTPFRQFYDRLIPNGPFGPNPNPVWGDVYGLFSNGERACISAALDDEQLAQALQNPIFPDVEMGGENDAEPRLEDVIILSCLSPDNAGALTFAMTFAGIVRAVEASGEDNACFQALLEPALEALSTPSPTEEQTLAIFGFFFGLLECGIEAAAPTSGASPS